MSLQKPTILNSSFKDEEIHYSDNSNKKSSSIKVNKLIFGILSKWYILVISIFLGLYASHYYLSKAPKKYTALSTLLIKQQTTSLMSREQFDELDMESSEGLNTAIERMRRAEFLIRVAKNPEITKLKGLKQPEPDWLPQWFKKWFQEGKLTQAEQTLPNPDTGELAGMIASWMNVSIRTGTRLMDVSVNHQIPIVAQTIANQISLEYINEIQGSISQGRESVSGALMGQSEQVRLKLQEAESSLATYNRAIEVHKNLEERENAFLELKRRYKDKHPKMIGALGDLTALETRFLQEFQFAIQSPADSSYWSSAGINIEKAKADQSSYLHLARQLLLARTAVLKGEISSQMQVFNTMLTRLEETNANGFNQDGSAEIHNLAYLPSKPSSPKNKKILTNGFLGGGALGFALAFFLTKRNNTFTAVSELEDELGLEVLAAIPKFKKLDKLKNDQSVQNTKKQELPDHLAFHENNIETSYSDSYRVLRTSISLLKKEKNSKVIAFTSALPGEGKSTVSSNYAHSLAILGIKTLLIELDLHRPQIGANFSITEDKSEKGIADFIENPNKFNDLIIEKSGIENLHLILSGKRLINPCEKLTDEILVKFIARATEDYEFIVIDTPPLLVAPSTRSIIHNCNQVCLVVKANHTPKSAVITSIRMLEKMNKRPSGVVLNDFVSSNNPYSYNYNYKSYYGKDHKKDVGYRYK